MSAARPGKVGNLPVETSSFVGRRQELRQVRQLLADSRVVTVTGVGGMGKTRLALRVAADLRRTFRDGVWLVDLAERRESNPLAREVEDPDVLAFLTASALGLRDQNGESALLTLARQLADQQLLLVLDNCEHTLPASAILADTLLRACPRLKVLATSRDPLLIPGEVTFALPPLPVPDPARRLGLPELTRYDSVTLFQDRAEAAHAGFQLTDENQMAVAELCRCLDGLPLAIELAAARTRVLAPEQILNRLADRFTMLSRGSRSAPARQQTLRACVEWSFDLCSKPERVLWARLSIFAGGCELDAVEGICPGPALPAESMLDLLTGLVEKSVLERKDQPGQAARFCMLETIRIYGQERLVDAGEHVVLRRRHGAWYQRLVARARTEWASNRQGYWLVRLGHEHANLRTAVETGLAGNGDADIALQTVTAVPLHYWWTRGSFGETRLWLHQALTLVPEASAVRARALLISSQLAFAQGDAEGGTRLLNEGERLARRLKADTEIRHAGCVRGIGALFGNDLPAAVAALARAWAILSVEPEPDLDLHMTLLVSLGVAAGLAGDRHWAGLALREMQAIVESLDGIFHRSAEQWVRAVVAWAAGDLSQAAGHAVENLRLARAWAAEIPHNLAEGLEVLAWITADQRHYRRAAILLGAADTCFTNAGSSITPQRHFAGHHEACLRRIQAALGDTAFLDAFQQGQTLILDRVLAYVLRNDRSPGMAPAGDDIQLTPREREVAQLIAEGLSNKEIAAALVVSQRTAESHVANILTKLGFTSRTQVAAWVASPAAPR